MTQRILVGFATTRGSTREVAESVAGTLRAHNLDVEVQPASAVDDVSGYDGVVLGAALYMGRAHADARTFLKRHRLALAEVPFAVFAMGPKTLDEHDVAGAGQQLARSLARVPEVKPLSVAIFGGVLDPTKLRFPLNRMEASDARDWDAIRAWAEEVAERFTRSCPIRPGRRIAEPVS
jgi:menaquinone-dependent protoporphyrinogen oxidase